MAVAINPLVRENPSIRARQLERSGLMWTVAEKVALAAAVVFTAAAFITMTGLLVVPNPLIPLGLLAGGLLARQIVEHTSHKATLYYAQAENERQVEAKQAERQGRFIEARIEIVKETVLQRRESFQKAMTETLSEPELQKNWRDYQSLALAATLYQSLLLNLQEDTSIPFTSAINVGEYQPMSYGLYQQHKPHGTDVFFKMNEVAPLTVTAIETAIEQDRVKELLVPFIAAARAKLLPARPQ